MINNFITPISELIKGVNTVIKNVFKNRVTIEYPEKKKQLNNNFRGKIKYEKEKCKICRICQKVCPSKNVIIIDNSFTINYARCIFCGNCVENCPHKALSFSKEYELAERNKQNLIQSEDLN